MPDTTTYGGDPIPTGPEGAWVPGSMMAYAEAIDPKLTHAVASQAERDALFATLPAGHLVTCPAAKTAWMSLGGSAWVTLAYDSGNVTLGFSYEPGWSTSGGGARIRNRSGVIGLSMALSYSGPDFVSAADGNIPDFPIGSVPAAYAPIGFNVVLTGTYAGLYVVCLLSPTGEITAVSGAPSHTFASGAVLNLSATWLGA